MKKQNLYLTVAVMAFTMIFSSCEKKYKGTTGFIPAYVINATNVEGGSSCIATIKAIMYWYSGDYEAASSEYKNGGFILNLPASVPDEYLRFINDEYFSEIISDKNAKVGSLSIFACDNDGYQIGNFAYRFSNRSAYYTAEYIYADRNFTIKGTINDRYYSTVFNCTFKRGWNIMYLIDEDNNELYTTQKPSDMNFKWYFYEYGPCYDSMSPKQRKMKLGKS